MNILILATLAPLCGFYIYALVNFQNEIRRAKQEARAGAKTIPLYSHNRQLSGFSPARDSVIESRQPEIVPEQQIPDVAGANNLIQDAYQPESTYIGPFLLIPIQKRKQPRSRQRVTEFAERRAG